MTYTEGQRVIYTKRGELRCYDTEWPGTYCYLTPAGKHAIRLDGRSRLSLVACQNLRAAQETSPSLGYHPNCVSPCPICDPPADECMDGSSP